MKRLAVFLAVMTALFASSPQTGAPVGAPAMPSPRPHSWASDNGNGTYSNPLFYEEFSDPDVIRVGPTSAARAAFFVVDRGLGRVALQKSGKFVSVAPDGTVSLKAAAANRSTDAETFQWVNLMRGHTMLMSLTNHRYLSTTPNQPGPLKATGTGPTPARKNGACFTWKVAEQTGLETTGLGIRTL